jgi:transposase-like protein
MTKAVARDPIYRRRRFQSETIELCVRWYLTYRLSYRDLVEMMAERGVTVSHSTILRWVQRYVPEFEQLFPCPFILEDGRDCGFGAGRCSLPLPGRR